MCFNGIVVLILVYMPLDYTIQTIAFNIWHGTGWDITCQYGMQIGCKVLFQRLCWWCHVVLAFSSQSLNVYSSTVIVQGKVGKQCYKYIVSNTVIQYILLVRNSNMQYSTRLPSVRVGGGRSKVNLQPLIRVSSNTSKYTKYNK